MRDTITKLRILSDQLRHTFSAWREDVWRHDLDERYCCDGRMCGCMGATRREVYGR